jgi:hypothetical protein
LYRTGAESAARSLGLRLHILDVRTLEDVERALALAARSGDEAAALMGPASQAFLFSSRHRVTAAALNLRRQDPQGRETGRSPHRAADQVRARDQPQDRKGTRSDDASFAAAPGGRDHPVMMAQAGRELTIAA